MPTTPLIALDAVVIDTETTGLDPAKARIVEIAAVRLVSRAARAGAKLSAGWCGPACRSRRRRARCTASTTRRSRMRRTFADGLAGACAFPGRTAC